MPATLLPTAAELRDILRDLRMLVDPPDVAHQPECVRLLARVDKVLAATESSPQPALASALTAREMFDLVERNPGAWATIAWEDPEAPEPIVGPVMRMEMLGTEGCGILTLAGSTSVVSASVRWPQARGVAAPQLVRLRAADGRVLWSRDQAPEADEVIRAAGALDLMSNALAHYALCWTRPQGNRANATFVGAFRDGTPFHTDNAHPPVFPDASAAVNDVFDRRNGIIRSS